MTIFRHIFFIARLGCWLPLILVGSCQKTSNSATPTPPPPTSPTPPGTTSELSYGDSVIYLRPQSTDYIVSPVKAATGEYIGFPDGLQLDGRTGEINVSKSETGLRYRVSFIAKGSTDTISTIVTISGINFLDGFYNLSAGDSIARPVYNAWTINTLPGINNGSLFDEGSSCNRQGCDVSTIDGQINLAQTVRNGVFGAVPSSNARKEFQMGYRINDNSQEALNGIDIKIYYFETMNDVTQEVYDIISSRQGTILGSSVDPLLHLQQATPRTVQVTGIQSQPAGKPRPPCIFIIGR